LSVKRGSVVYCLIPRELAPKLHELLRRHFRHDSSVEVIVERRMGERRAVARRSDAESQPRTGAAERRRVRDVQGRRVSERRGTVVLVDARPLPRRARPHAERLAFVELLAPKARETEDAASDRLVARFQAGDRDAFTELYIRYFDRIYKYLRIILRSQHDAEDAAQQVFLKALDALPRYERRDRPFRSWLFVVARNHALDELARRARTEPVAPFELERAHDAPAPDGDALDSLEWLSDRDVVIFIERLPLLQRQVLVLRFLLELNSAEIAAVLGTTPDTVRNQQARAMRFLRERLASLGRTPARPNRARMQRRIPPAPVARARRFALHNW
jgi:RNA polymerase sigma-70 factor (ECF subfamily)